MTTDTAGEARPQVALYSATERALAELRQRMAAVVYDVQTTKGLDAAKRDRRELVTLRTSLEAERKRLKEPALEHARRIDSEAKRLTGEIEALEDPIDAQIKAEEARREAEKRAKEEAERKRVADIQALIDGYRHAVADATGLTSAQIAERRNALAATRFDEAWPAQFAEFADEAKAARDGAVIGLADLQDRVAAQEAEAARLAAERAELEELRRMQAAQREREDAERRRQEAERQAAVKAEEEQRAATRREEEARLAASRAAEQREAEEKRANEAAALRAERERLAAQAAELERQREAVAAEARRQREADEAREKAERDRQEAEARAKAEAEPTVENVLVRCEAFIAGFEDVDDDDTLAVVHPLLADLRRLIAAEEFA